MKTCRDCNIVLTEENWYPSLQKVRTYVCISCNLHRTNKWKQDNPEKCKESRRKSNLKKKYGISVEEYDKQFKEQNGRCYLCNSQGERRRLNVDHCHKTGAVRKLLCDKCNLALGLVDDSVELLENFIRYLK